jgi:cell division protein FtsL
MEKNQENQKEELEQKISEAEMEAQLAASQAGGMSAPIEEEPAETAAVEVPPEKKKMSKARLIWRRILIWLVVIAIAFAGGFYLDTYLRYHPALDQIASLNDQIANLNTDLGDKDGEIASLQSEIDRLSQFEDLNTGLKDEIDQLEIHLKVLTARASVADASLAVEQERNADARLALNKLGTTLESLKDTLAADQTEVVDSMIQRYQLVVSELDTEGYSALTDLDLLANRLIALENNLFATP